MNSKDNMGYGMTYSSNVITGTIGALLGSIVGVALWALIYHLGYIASIAGFVIIIGAIKGYQLLGRAIDLKGIIIAGIISLVMVFVANYVSWTMEVYLVYKDMAEISFIDAARALPDLISTLELQGDYFGDLAMGYGLTLLGGASTLVKMFKQAR